MAALLAELHPPQSLGPRRPSLPVTSSHAPLPARVARTAGACALPPRGRRGDGRQQRRAAAGGGAARLRAQLRRQQQPTWRRGGRAVPQVSPLPGTRSLAGKGRRPGSRPCAGGRERPLPLCAGSRRGSLVLRPAHVPPVPGLSPALWAGRRAARKRDVGGNSSMRGRGVRTGLSRRAVGTGAASSASPSPAVFVRRC